MDTVFSNMYRIVRYSYTVYFVSCEELMAFWMAQYLWDKMYGTIGMTQLNQLKQLSPEDSIQFEGHQQPGALPGAQGKGLK